MPTLIIIFSLLILITLPVYLLIRLSRNTASPNQYDKADSSNVSDIAPQPIAKSAYTYVEELGCELSQEGIKRWNHLLVIKLGDKKGASNLVDYEKGFNPGASTEILIQAAIARWIDDNNRR